MTDTWEVIALPQGDEVHKNGRLVSSSEVEKTLNAYESLQAECERLREEAATEQNLQRSAQNLPEGWRVTVEVEKDAGWVDVFDPSGNRIQTDLTGTLAEQLEQAIDAAKEGAKS